MPDYRDIYNKIVTQELRYNLAENSPGLRAVIQASEKLSLLAGRSLDVGCGVGFAVEYLSSPTFNFRAFGVDISDEAIVKAIERTKHIGGLGQRFFASSNQQLPFEDNFFSLVTCFDVLEHLDECDIDETLNEIKRVVRNRGVLFLSVSCRKSGSNDQFGDNLHRSVESPDWWIEKVDPDRAEYDGKKKQFSMWKQLKKENQDAAKP